MSELHTVSRLEDVPDPAPDAVFVVVDVIISSYCRTYSREQFRNPGVAKSFTQLCPAVSTSIVSLLEAGASSVRPFADADTARAFGKQTGDAVLVGEQGGRPVDGFDCSPLPSLIATQDFTDRPVGILTSNGTRAVHHIGPDREIVIGSTVNAGAVADFLREQQTDVWLVAAGRQGEVVPEDTAGVDLIERHYRDDLSDDAVASLRADIETSRTADWLSDIGFENEVEDLLAFDATGTVPHLRDSAFVSV